MAVKKSVMQKERGRGVAKELLTGSAPTAAGHADAIHESIKSNAAFT
jgi:hypothetical protein